MVTQSKDETWSCLGCGQWRPTEEFFNAAGGIHIKCSTCRDGAPPDEPKTKKRGDGCWMCGKAEEPPEKTGARLCKRHAQYVANEASRLSKARKATGGWEDDGTDDIPDVQTEIALAVEPEEAPVEAKRAPGHEPEPQRWESERVLLVDYEQGLVLLKSPGEVKETRFAELAMGMPVPEVIETFRRDGVEVVTVGRAAWVRDVEQRMDALRAEMRADRRAKAEAEAKLAEMAGAMQSTYEELYEAVTQEDAETGLNQAAQVLMRLERRG